METMTYGEYGQRERGLKSTQIIMLDGTPYLVEYVVENLASPMGTLEVLDITVLQDEFGMGNLTRGAVADSYLYQRVEAEFLTFIRGAVKSAMGIFW